MAAKKLNQQQQLLEAIIPNSLNEAFENLSDTFADELKTVRLATAEAINEQHTIALAQMNQGVSDNAQEFSGQIKKLEGDNQSLKGQILDLDTEIISRDKMITELNSKVQKLQEQVDYLAKRGKGKEEADTQVARLQGRLDVYESFPKPTAPVRSQSTKK